MPTALDVTRPLASVFASNTASASISSLSGLASSPRIANRGPADNETRLDRSPLSLLRPRSASATSAEESCAVSPLNKVRAPSRVGLNPLSGLTSRTSRAAMDARILVMRFSVSIRDRLFDRTSEGWAGRRSRGRKKVSSAIICLRGVSDIPYSA